MLTNPASTDVLPALEDLPALAPQSAPALRPYQGALARRVASQPLRSVLIALGAGGLAAAAVRLLVTRKMR